MSKENWVRMFANGWKPHWVPSSLFQDLVSDAQRRFHTFEDSEPAEAGWVDLPGMVMVDRTYQDYDIDGFKLSIPTSDFAYYRQELNKPVREFASGARYYKLHGWLNCVVVSEAQRDALVATMDARAEAVLAQAKLEDAEFTRRIRSINEGGIKVITPRDPQSLEGHVNLVSKPNGEKN